LPFEEEALRAANRLDLAGTDVPVARAEDLIIYKAVAWRDRDRGDIEGLLKLHGPIIDLERVRRIIAEFAEALGLPDRMEEFDQLVDRVLTAPGKKPPRSRR
jgi:predicted nucleotidyltransferase